LRFQFGLALPIGARITPIPRIHINISYAFIEEDFLLEAEQKYFETREISIEISYITWEISSSKKSVFTTYTQ